MDSTIVVHGPRRVAATLGIVLLVAGLSGVGLYGAGSAAGTFSSGSSIGGHSATAPVTAVGSLRTEIALLVAPTLTLSPTTATVGSTVYANGTGFNASASINVTWAGAPSVLCPPATTTSNATGDFSCSFVVPSEAHGTYNVSAADNASVPHTANATLGVRASITLSPSSGPSGTMVTLTGTGYAAGSLVSAVWSPGAVALCSNTSGALGDAACTFSVPAGAALASHTVTATDGATNSATSSFLVLAAPPPPPTVSVAFTTPFTLYMPTPLTLGWTITASDAVNIHTTNMWLLIEDLGSSACPYIIYNGLKQGVAVQNTPCPVANLSLDSLLVNNTDSYTYTLSVANMTIQNYNSGTLPYGTEYSVAIYVNMSTSPYVNGTTTGSVGQGGATQDIYLQTYLPSATLVSPLPNSGISTGNVSVVVSYSGDFVTGATVDIYSGSASGQLVYSAGVAQAGIGPHVGSAAAQWRPTVAGAYTAVVNLSGPYGYSLTSFALTVVPAGTDVYVNTSSYHNESLIPGLTEGTSATLLLVVGLVIGMVVALVLARMVWGGAGAAKPPQPWAAKTGETKPEDQKDLKTNECPVCHQQFGSADELAAHQKKDHGTGST